MVKPLIAKLYRSYKLMAFTFGKVLGVVVGGSRWSVNGLAIVPNIIRREVNLIFFKFSIYFRPVTHYGYS